jgi:formylglycine-generating enzyme required for sulfatase activity
MRNALGMLAPLACAVVAAAGVSCTRRDRAYVQMRDPDEAIVSITDVEMVFRLVPAGEFMMGGYEGYPYEPLAGATDRLQHAVVLTRSFWIGKYEVTEHQYRLVTGHDDHGDSPILPGAKVSWREATAFCGALTEITGMRFRLPTEAEWERACRAGSTSNFCHGNDIGDLEKYAWFRVPDAVRYRAMGRGPFQVGMKLPNALGIHDMHGNVAEWCNDYYDDEYYSHSPMYDPTGPATGAAHVVRGGAWNDGAYHVRCSHRWGATDEQVADTDVALGFRVVCDDLSAGVVDAVTARKE